MTTSPPTKRSVPDIKFTHGDVTGCMYLMPIHSALLGYGFDVRLKDALGMKDFAERGHDRLVRRVSEVFEEHLPTPELREQLINQPPSLYTPEVVAWTIHYNGEHSSISFSHHRYHIQMQFDYGNAINERYTIGVYRTEDQSRGSGWVKQFEYSSDMADIFEEILKAAIAHADLTAIHGVNTIFEETLAGLLKPRVVMWDDPTYHGPADKMIGHNVQVRPWDTGEQVVGFRRSLEPLINNQPA